MCGFAGIAGVSADHARLAAAAMSRAMADRGPDGSGVWGSDDVVLCHRRLSIIDLAGGAQPFRTNSRGKELVLAWNGEIYNHRELRAELRSVGVSFRTESDTEVLAEAISVWGVRNALSRMRGMFALAAWEPGENRLTLARDRLGIKPLFYNEGAGSIVFSSTLDSLMQCELVPRVMSTEALEYVLTLGYPMAPQTCFEGVFELPPGCILTWTRGRRSIERYWKLDWTRRFDGKVEEAERRLDSLLDSAVREHMVSDVPIAAFLSGGLDSSTVVSRAAPFAGQDFKVFTVSTKDPAYDESAVAAQTARAFGVRHEVIPAEDIVFDENTLPFIVRKIGQPFADSSCLPTFLVSKAARARSKVVLAGDGGDELFAGYTDFDWVSRIRRGRVIPGPLRRAALSGLTRLRVDGRVGDRVRQLRKGLAYSSDTLPELIVHIKSIIDREELVRMAPVWKELGTDLAGLRGYLEELDGSDWPTALTRFLVEIGLPGDMLTKVDRMSMAASLEVRVPFLDHRIVEFACSLPIEMKIREGKRKWLLRRVSGRLPAAVLSQRKMGFSIPLQKMFSPRFLQSCEERLLDRKSCVRDWFGEDFLKMLLDWNSRGAGSGSSQWSDYTVSHCLWVLAQVETWRAEYGVALPAAALSPRI